MAFDAEKEGKKTAPVATKVALLCAASLTVMSGAIIAPALPEIRDGFLHTRNVDELVPLVLTSTGLAIAIGSMPAGYLVDRWGRKPLLVCGLILYALAGSAGLYIDNLYGLLGSRLLLGLAVAAIATSAATLVADLFKGGERQRFLGIQGSAMALGGVVYLLFGGYLAELSWRGPFAVYLLALVVLGLVAWVVREPEKADATDGELAAGDRGKAPIASIALLYGTAFFGMMLIYLIASQIPFLLQRRQVVQPFMVGTVIATSNLFASGSAYAYGRLRGALDVRQTFALIFGLIGAGFTVAALSSQLSSLYLGMAICGAGAGLLMPNANAQLALLAPASARGRLFGGLTSSVFIGQFVSPLFVLPVVRINGYEGLLGAFGFAAFVSFVLGLLYLGSTFGRRPAAEAGSGPG